MLDRPIGGFLGSADGYTAKCILFQLMAGFCAHKLPFWYERWLDKLKVYQYQNTPSKGVSVASSQAQRLTWVPSSESGQRSACLLFHVIIILSPEPRKVPAEVQFEVTPNTVTDIT